MQKATQRKLFLEHAEVSEPRRNAEAMQQRTPKTAMTINYFQKHKHQAILQEQTLHGRADGPSQGTYTCTQKSSLHIETFWVEAGRREFKQLLH